MRHLPVFVTIARRRVLIVGGGTVAARKTGTILRAGGRPLVVSPTICPALRKLKREGRIRHVARGFRATDVEGCALVIAATDDTHLNRRVYTAADSARILVNVVDCPELCSFIMPAVVDRSPLLIAVSSGGSAPVLTRHLKARLETAIPAGYGRLAALAGSFRAQVRQRLGNAAARRRFWENALHSPAGDRVLAGHEDQAHAMMQQLLDNAAKGKDSSLTGEVYLVGAGAGDPDLLTFRALRLMQQADVVLYDKLVTQEILDLVRRDAERIDVGKRAGSQAMPQADINRLMVALAGSGLRVLRLKGGDPFLFGRGGEELEFLAAHDIPFQIVPGITAAIGCAAYAGIPLTHRDHAQACVFVTGHTKNGAPDLNWGALAQPRQTVVVYMGLRSAGIIAQRLIEHGAEPDRPAAIVENGTRADQRVTTATLATLSAAAGRVPPGTPALIVIGEVVRLAPALSWFLPSADVVGSSVRATAIA